MNKKASTLAILIRITSFLILISGSYIVYDSFSQDTVKIANWNLQIFGVSKASDIELIKSYTQIIDDYDIIFIQEIRDSSNTAFPELCSMLQNYSCFSSSRAGRSSSKEQYGIIYKNSINLTFFQDFNPDEQDKWERPPIKVNFQINNYKLTIYNIHIKPDDAQQELDYLEELIPDSNNVILLGDLNADCSYYNAEKETEFDNWNWIIKNEDDTTSTSSNCAYDRIILNSNAYEEYVSHGIHKQDITTSLSDHYLVWVEMKIG